MRNKAKNARLAKKEVGMKFLTGAVSVGSGYLAGLAMGGAEYDLSEMKVKGMTDEQIAEAGDPTKWAGIDKDAVVGVALLAAGLYNVGGRKVAPALEASGVGVLSGWGYSRGRDMGFDNAKEVE
jgi:hypothetical protein